MKLFTPSVLLVGVGSVAKKMHIPYLRSLSVAVRGAVDPDPRARDYVHRQFPQARTYETLSLVPENINIAVVTSPTALHYASVKFLVSKGVHVLCEKPLAASYRQAAELFAMANSKIVLQVGFYRRFHQTSWVAKQLMRNGHLGQLHYCQIYGGHVVRHGELPFSYFDRRLSSGGVLIDFGSHLIDRLLSWFDELTLERYFDDSSGGIEANCCALFLGVVSGRKIPIRLSLSRTAELGYYADLEFDRATVRIFHNEGSRLVIRSRGSGHQDSEIRLTPLDEPLLGYFISQWREFVSRIQGQPETFSSLRDAVKTNRIIDACYRSGGKLHLKWEYEYRKWL